MTTSLLIVVGLCACAADTAPAGTSGLHHRETSALGSLKEPHVGGPHEKLLAQLVGLADMDGAPLPTSEGYRILTGPLARSPSPFTARRRESVWHVPQLGLEAQLSHTADGPIVIGPIGDPRRVVVERHLANEEPALIEGNALVYPAAVPEVDVWFYKLGTSLEELLVIHGPEAEISYTYNVPSGSSVRLSSNNLIEIVDETKAAWLRVRFDRAWDKHGAPARFRIEVDQSTVHLKILDNPALPVILDPTWETTKEMHVARAQHTATLLKKSGKVLIAGGQSGATMTAIADAEIFDPKGNMGDGSFTTVGSMTIPRHLHTATELEDGRVLIVAGLDEADYRRSEVDLFDPDTETFTPAPHLLLSFRARHTATLVSDSVYIIGGERGPLNPPIEAYAPDGDMGAGKWTSSRSLHVERDSHTATLLNGGAILVIGGVILDQNEFGSDLVELCDPSYPHTKADPFQDGYLATVRCAQVQSLNRKRFAHVANKIENGDVIVAGGQEHQTASWDNAECNCKCDGSGEQNCEYKMNAPRAWFTGTELDNKWILYVGGDPQLTKEDHAELFDPIGRRFHLAQPLPSEVASPKRMKHTATKLLSGAVLIAGGSVGGAVSPASRSTELFVPLEQGENCLVQGVPVNGLCRGGHCNYSKCDDPCKGDYDCSNGYECDSDSHCVEPNYGERSGCFCSTASIEVTWRWPSALALALIAGYFRRRTGRRRARR